MSKWIQNFVAYIENKTIEKCPYCSSTEVDVQEHKGSRKSITFTCENCGKSEHFDGTLD